jgi:FkbM family methyltransferase
MNKYAFAARHSLTSLAGWMRTFFSNPSFALALLRRRWEYFSRRKFAPLLTPDGFLLNTPDALVSYWLMFVERELHNHEWVEPLQAVSQPLVVDVGANVGVFSHLVFCINSRAEVIAFEPLPALHQKLEALRERTGIKLDIRAKAVGRKLGEALLESPHGYEGISRICVSDKPAGQTYRVKITALDQELTGREILLMKIDVEGYECEVIAGAKQTLLRTRFLIVEAHTVQHRDAITAELGPGWTRQRLGPSDYLFCRQPHN